MTWEDLPGILDFVPQPDQNDSNDADDSGEHWIQHSDTMLFQT